MSWKILSLFARFHKRASCFLFPLPPYIPQLLFFRKNSMTSLCLWHSGPLGEIERKSEASSYTEHKSFDRAAYRFPQIFTRYSQIFQEQSWPSDGKRKHSSFLALSNNSLMVVARRGGLKPRGIDWKDKALGTRSPRLATYFIQFPPFLSIPFESTLIHSVF